MLPCRPRAPRQQPIAVHLSCAGALSILRTTARGASRFLCSPPLPDLPEFGRITTDSSMPIDLPIDVQPLPYEHKLLERRVEDVDLLVIHCTELPELAQARTYGERVIYADTGTGASGHFYIERDGRIVRYVDPLRAANHTRGHNARSIGVELVNRGRYPDWYASDSQVMTDPYTEPT